MPGHLDSIAIKPESSGKWEKGPVPRRITGLPSTSDSSNAVYPLSRPSLGAGRLPLEPTRC